MAKGNDRPPWSLCPDEQGVCQGAVGWTAAGADLSPELQSGTRQHPECQASPSQHDQLVLRPTNRLPHLCLPSHHLILVHSLPIFCLARHRHRVLFPSYQALLPVHLQPVNIMCRWYVSVLCRWCVSVLCRWCVSVLCRWCVSVLCRLCVSVLCRWCVV